MEKLYATVVQKPKISCVLKLFHSSVMVSKE